MFTEILPRFCAGVTFAWDNDCKDIVRRRRTGHCTVVSRQMSNSREGRLCESGGKEVGESW